MGKLLRVVVVILLFFSAGALTLGILLFNKRELLKGRTQKLENTVFRLGPVIEAEEPTPPAKDFPARDTSPCTSEILDNPQRSAFWETYKIEYEVVDLAKLNMRAKERELKTYYKIAFDGTIERDEMTGIKKTDGEGTMQAALDDMVKKATDQYNRLNDTRVQLMALREEYIETINDLNQQKQELRQARNEIVQLKAKIAELEAEIVQLKAKIAELEAEIERLKTHIAELEVIIAKQKEEIEDQKSEIASLNARIDELEGILEGGRSIRYAIAAGKKGEVVGVSRDWGFVVVKVSDVFLKELLGRDLDRAAPRMLDLIVKRPGDNGKFVTKVRLTSVRKDDNIVVADIMPIWKKGEPAIGDGLFY